MFKSATIKLTTWYLAILMTISLIFSVVIYQINYHEIEVRLENYQQKVIEVMPGVYMKGETSEDLSQPLDTETRAASKQLILALAWVNLFVLMFGGVASYLFARRTLQPIEDAHEAQSRFTSDASHELRTPLAAMKTELEVALKDPKLTKSESRELLASSLEEVNKIIDLSETLLKLSRLDSNETLSKEPFDLEEVLHIKLDHYRDQAERFDLSIRKNTLVNGNIPAITDLIGILIDNAIKYSPEGSTIKIRTFVSKGMVGVEVQNKGKQIPQEHIDKLFDRFYQVDASRTSSQQNRGYGLGLSIAKKIADIHNGYIEVVSTTDQTKFTYFMPVYRKTQPNLKIHR